MIRARDNQDGQNTDSSEERSDADWGFSEGKKGMTGGSKIGLLLVLVVLGTFGFLAYKKSNDPGRLFQKGDGEGKLPVAKTKQKPDENRKSNEFGSEWENSAGQEGSGSFENQNVVQQEPVQENDNQFWNEENTSQGGIQDQNVRQTGEFYPEENQYPFSQSPQQSDGRSDSFPANENSQEANSEFFDDRQQTNEFDRNGYPDQFQQSGNLEQVSQQQTGMQQQTAMNEENLTDPFGEKIGSGQTGNDRSVQQASSGEAAYAEEQQFFDDSTGRDESTSQSASYGHQDFSANSSPWEQNTGATNKTPQSTQSTLDGHAQTEETPRSLFEERTASNEPYQQESDSNDFQDSRYGNEPDTGFNRSAAGSTTSVGHAGESTSLFNTDNSNSGSQYGDFNSQSASQQSFGANTQQDQTAVYEIQTGDNYWIISKKQYGTARYFMALSRYNRQRIPDEKRMRPGMKVLIPRPEILEARNPDLFPRRLTQSAVSQENRVVAAEGSQSPGFFRGRSGEPLYRVGEKDTLSEIAQDHLGRSSRWIQVYEMNRSRLPDPNNLKIGTVLRLPADAGNVRLVRNLREDR